MHPDHYCISSPKVMGKYGSQILAYLIKAGEGSKIDCALDHGPDPNNANETALSVVLATKLGNFDIVNQLRERGDISARNHPYNIDAVELAAAVANSMWLHRMRERQVAENVEYDWNCTSTFGRDPNGGYLNDEFLLSDCNSLHIAAGQGNMAVMRFLAAEDLIKYFNVRAAEGYTPLHVSTMFDRIEVLEWLARMGTDVSAVDGCGKMALDIALENCKLSLIDRTLEAAFACIWNSKQKHRACRHRYFQEVFSRYYIGL